MREYTEAGIQQRCLGVNSPELRRRAVPGWHVSAQKTSSYITARPWLPGLIMGPCPSEESLCCPAPPPPPCFADSRPPVSKVACLISILVFALHLYVSHVQSHHFPWLQPHELQSIRSSLLTAIRTHHPISHVSLGEAPSRLRHTVFPPEGLLLSGQGGCSRRPYQGERGSVPVLPLGRKLDWQPVLSRAPKDPYLAV